MRKPLDEEHERLHEEATALQREHDRLRAEWPPNLAAHRHHKNRLRELITKLRDHLARLEKARL